MVRYLLTKRKGLRFEVCGLWKRNIIHLHPTPHTPHPTPHTPYFAPHALSLLLIIGTSEKMIFSQFLLILLMIKTKL
jgi:hypothetical protein